ncbi:MAG: DUF4340 domain-containing protein [Chromatiales bacterium]|nr:DUF4340 domain-containing protein [Chromatiales bacterium]
MNRRSLSWLVGILVVLAVLAGVALRGQRSTSPTEGPFLPGLRDDLNGISRIVITGPGNANVATLERGADRWTVAGRDNYPADVGRIRKNLLALAEARIVEEKTANPGFYDRLGVQDVSSPSAGGLQLTITGGREPIDLIVGLAQPGAADLTYVRRVGEPGSWLIAARFDLAKTGGEWLDRALTDIPAERIQSVTIDHPGAETLRISRAPAAEQPAGDQDGAPEGIVEFRVAGIPAGRELSYPGVANGVASALADLKLEDVQPRDSLGADPGKPVVARFVTTDGLAVEASAWRLGDGTRITFTASGDGAAAKEAADLNARLGGWAYTLPSYKTELLTRRLAELLAPR